MRWLTWLGGGVGWALSGPIGALFGAALGKAVSDLLSPDAPDVRTRRAAGGGPRITTETDLRASLLVLAASVIKSDGQVDQRALDSVRQRSGQRVLPALQENRGHGGGIGDRRYPN